MSAGDSGPRVAVPGCHRFHQDSGTPTDPRLTVRRRARGGRAPPRVAIAGDGSLVCGARAARHRSLVDDGAPVRCHARRRGSSSPCPTPGVGPTDSGWNVRGHGRGPFWLFSGLCSVFQHLAGMVVGQLLLAIRRAPARPHDGDGPGRPIHPVESGSDSAIDELHVLVYAFTPTAARRNADVRRSASCPQGIRSDRRLRLWTSNA